MTAKREILVVPRNKLFEHFVFQGFLPAEKHPFESVILDNYEYMEKQAAENNPEYKQPIAYAAIVNKYTKKIFGYYRSKEEKHYTEKKLQGKFSIGVAGHIEKTDDRHDPILESLHRELGEEVHILGTKSGPKLLGYINDDSNDVGKVHFGLLYYIETNAKTIKPRDPEIEKGRLYNAKRLERMVFNNDNRGRAAEYFKPSQVESWARISLPILVNNIYQF